MVIHFHSADERSCHHGKPKGSFGLVQCTFDPNVVTCEACKGRDTFVLTADAEAYLDNLPPDPRTGRPAGKHFRPTYDGLYSGEWKHPSLVKD